MWRITARGWRVAPWVIAMLASTGPLHAQYASDSDSLDSAAAVTRESGNFIAVGPAVTPAFPGSDNYRVHPFIAGKYEPRSGSLAIEFTGSSVRLDLNPDGRVGFGPILNLRGGRDAEQGSGPQQELRNVKHALELGAYANYRAGGNAQGQGSFKYGLTWLHDVNHAYSGSTLTGRIGYAAVRNRIWTLTVGVNGTWASRNFMRTYFSVDAVNAALTGFPQYRAGAGLRNLGVGATATAMLNRHWGAIGYIGAVRYVGDAKDSPITHAGSANSGMLALALARRF